MVNENEMDFTDFEKENQTVKMDPQLISNAFSHFRKCFEFNHMFIFYMDWFVDCWSQTELYMKRLRSSIIS